MKRYLSIILSVAICICSFVSAPVFADEGIEVILNGEKIDFDVAPFVENGTVMVPMRAVFEALDAEVIWDAEAYTAIAIKGVDTICFTIDDTQIYDDCYAAVISCEVAPKIVDNRTFVPLRAIGEILDCNVGWDEATRTVYVDEKKSLVEVTYKTEQIVLDTAHEFAKVVVNYTYPEVTDGKDFMTPENVDKLNQMITQQRIGLFDVYEYAATFAEDWQVIIEYQMYGYPNVTLNFVTKLYTSDKYDTISISTGVNMPWVGGNIVSETLDKDTLLKKELHECFRYKEPEMLYSQIYDHFVKDYEWVRYGKEELEEIPGIVPFVITDDDLRVYMSAISLTGVGRSERYFTVVDKY